MRFDREQSDGVDQRRQRRVVGIVKNPKDIFLMGLKLSRPRVAELDSFANRAHWRWRGRFAPGPLPATWRGRGSATN